MPSAKSGLEDRICPGPLKSSPKHRDHISTAGEARGDYWEVPFSRSPQGPACRHLSRSSRWKLLVLAKSSVLCSLLTTSEILGRHVSLESTDGLAIDSVDPASHTTHITHSAHFLNTARRRGIYLPSNIPESLSIPRPSYVVPFWVV